MSDIQKMLRAIINNQSSLRQEMLEEFKKTNKKIEGIEQKLAKKLVD
jgi:hypothetical protein